MTGATGGPRDAREDIDPVAGLVSVVVPTYQSEEFVEATLASLVAQTYGSWECIVSDDASSDRTLERVKALTAGDPRFRVLAHETRLGAPGNWNRAAAEARGEFVKLLCADDLLYEQALEEQVEALSAAPGAVLASGRRDVIDRLGRRVMTGRGLPGPARRIEGLACLRLFVRTGTNFFGEPSFVLFRTETLRRAGGFPAQADYLVDVSTYASVLQRGDLVTTGRTVGAFRVHTSSWTSALRHGQSRATRQCVRAVAARPGVDASLADLTFGLVRATVNAYGRRGVYAWLALKDRLRPISAR